MTTKAEGERLRSFRLGTGLTQKDLAKLCRVSVSTISAAEASGRGTRLSTLLKICKALNIRPEHLAEETGGFEETPEATRAAAFQDLLAKFQESQRNLLLFLYDSPVPHGKERISLGPSDPSGSVALGEQTGTPRVRGRSRRKS